MCDSDEDYDAIIALLLQEENARYSRECRALRASQRSSSVLAELIVGGIIIWLFSQVF